MKHLNEYVIEKLKINSNTKIREEWYLICYKDLYNSVLYSFNETFDKFKKKLYELDNKGIVPLRCVQLDKSDFELVRDVVVNFEAHPTRKGQLDLERLYDDGVIEDIDYEEYL